MVVILVSNLKGGIGKTTTTINLAYSFSLLGKKVLIIDGDPQANATSMFGKVNKTGYSILNLLREPKKAKSYIFRSKYKDIDIVRGNTALYESDVTSPDWLNTVKDIVGDTYDICLVDTAPTYNAFVMSALYCSDIILTPIELDAYCRDNLATVKEHLDSLPADAEPEWKIFANKVRGNRKSQKDIYVEYRTTTDYPFMNTCVMDSATFQSAIKANKPVIKHRRTSAAASDFMQLAEELLEEMEV